MYYKCHKINPNGGGSYVDSPEDKKQKSNKYYQIKMIINAFNML